MCRSYWKYTQSQLLKMMFAVCQLGLDAVRLEMEQDIFYKVKVGFVMDEGDCGYYFAILTNRDLLNMVLRTGFCNKEFLHNQHFARRGDLFWTVFKTDPHWATHESL